MTNEQGYYIFDERNTLRNRLVVSVAFENSNGERADYFRIWIHSLVYAVKVCADAYVVKTRYLPNVGDVSCGRK